MILLIFSNANQRVGCVPFIQFELGSLLLQYAVGNQIEKSHLRKYQRQLSGQYVVCGTWRGCANTLNAFRLSERSPHDTSTAYFLHSFFFFTLFTVRICAQPKASHYNFHVNRTVIFFSLIFYFTFFHRGTLLAVFRFQHKHIRRQFLFFSIMQ